MANVNSSSPYKGSGSITREQFLFYEMRTTAKLMLEGLSDKEIISRIFEENLFQYPTEKTINSISKACVNRLKALNDMSLVQAIATRPVDVSKQICLYAMIKQYRLMWDFMLTVIGEKYRSQDYSFSEMDINVFFMRLQEQDDLVASWSDATVHRIVLVLIKILVENEYLDDRKSNKLNPVLIDSFLENAIRNNNDDIVLPAFNCFY